MPLGEKPRVLRFDGINLLLMQTQQKGNKNKVVWRTEWRLISTSVITSEICDINPNLQRWK